MKKHSLSFVSLVLVVSTVVLFSSCKRINEATELGGSLVPEIDNIHTFETYLNTETNNALLNDTTRLVYSDNVAIGNITNDPEFGKTNAEAYFTLSAPAYGNYPFTSKDGFGVDSVVLSLSYTAGYGDTNSLQTVKVYEIDPSSTFSDTAFYKFNHAAFTTTGSALGSKSFALSSLKDSIKIIRKDTTKTANELRIKIDNSLGYRLAAFDTAATTNGGYHDDSTFKTLFRGLAIKNETGSGNSLGFYKLSDAAKTKLTVYYKATKNGVTDTSSVVYTHRQRVNAANLLVAGGQANLINRTAGGNYQTYINNTTSVDDKLYIQSTPGSYATVKIPGLDTLSNSVVHRAELIVTPIPSALDQIFTAPPQLFLDMINAAGDSATVVKDFSASSQTGAIDFTTSGGLLKSNKYVFNLTKHVQAIISKGGKNNTLRIYAPFETRPYGVAFPLIALPYPALGRVVLAGGNYADPSLRLRLRIVYSKI